MALVISPKIREKLATRHSVTPEEVAQCFANMTGKCLMDTREDHATDPPTLWFISETDYGRKLKVVYVKEDGDIFLKSAFTPRNRIEYIQEIWQLNNLAGQVVSFAVDTTRATSN